MKGGVVYRELPYTPGATHAAHMHWRWGAFSATHTPAGPGGPQYAGFEGPGTPMIDGRIPNQSLRFAITTSRHAEEISKLLRNDNATEAQDFDSFETLFTAQGHKDPEPIADGAELVTWVSIAGIEFMFHNKTF